MTLDVDWTAFVVLAIYLAIIVLAATVVSANRKPSSAIAWVMAVVFIPVVGVLFFLLVGNGRLPKHRRDEQRQVTEAIMQRTRGSLNQLSSAEPWPDWLPSIATLNRNLGALPMVGGNTARLLGDYTASIEAMAAEIDAAKEYVHVEFFILVGDEETKPFFDALARACARGVTVRVLSDHLAQFSYPNRKKTLRILQEMGAQYMPMLPAAAVQGALASSGHAQPPQARRRRRGDRLRRLAEPDQGPLPQEGQHQARACTGTS